MVMDAAGNPGLKRKFGSAMREAVGQHEDEFWATLVGDDGQEVRVFADGRHGWTNELVLSDRPRGRDVDISPAQLRTALDQILAEHGLSWP